MSSPRLLQAGVTLNELGIPPELALDTLAQIQKHAGVLRARLREALPRRRLEAVRGGRHAGHQWADVRTALERLRPLAAEAHLAVFEPIMSQAAEDAFGRELERLRRSGQPSPSGGRRRSRTRPSRRR